jgi:hypothetical protein
VVVVPGLRNAFLQKENEMKQPLPHFFEAPFMTVRDKELTFKDWLRFIHGFIDLSLTKDQLRCRFTRRLYEYLTMHAAFIAHFNEQGFWETYFEEPEDTIRFFSQFDPDGEQQSVEYGGHFWVGGPDGGYRDINEAMIEATRPYQSAIRNRAGLEQRNLDVKRGRALLAKHGLERI